MGNSGRRLPAPIGSAVLAAGLLAAGAACAADPFNGRLIFTQCETCHAIKGKGGTQGPPLDGIFGRKAAGVEGFAYSDAFRALDVTWSEQTLDAYLAKPDAFAPGTKMVYSGLPKAEDRADLIAYLKQATGG